MAKKQNVKKPKAPRKRRAPARGKAGAKDKSVKQNVNVNVTSSGGGGSGGASIPSAQPSYNPFITSSLQGQKLGEDIQIKKLTDLLNKTITQASKPSQNIVEKATEKVVETPIEPKVEPKVETRQQPLFEGDEFNIDYQIERKPSNLNMSLLQNVNTPKQQDEAEQVNQPEVVEQAEQANVEAVFEEEVSKPDEGDVAKLEDVNIENYTPEELKQLKKFVKKNDVKLNKIAENTFEYYKIAGQNLPLLEDNVVGKYKIIDNNVVPWDTGSGERNRPLKRHIQVITRDFFFTNQEKFATYSDNKKLKIVDEPKPVQQQQLIDALNKVSKGKKSRSKKADDLAGGDIEV